MSVNYATATQQDSVNLGMTKRLLDKARADALAYKSTCEEQSKRIKNLKNQIQNQKRLMVDLKRKLDESEKRQDQPQGIRSILGEQAQTIRYLIQKNKDLEESRALSENQAAKWKKAFLAVSSDVDFVPK